MNLNDFLARAADEHGHRCAVELGDQRLSYAELDALAGRTAALLATRGVLPGDRVGLMLPNMPEFPVLYYGVLRAGGRRGADEPPAQVARDRLLPARLGHGAALRLGQRRRDEARSGAEGRRDRRWCRSRPVGSTQLLAEHPDPAPTAPRESADTAVILYTSGHHRRAQGRRAHPRQPGPQRRDHRAHPAPARPPTTSSSAACRCSTPSARPAR